MDNFSISQLEQFSGIKAHTIRMWELRYNALHPSRSKGNTRFYNNSQLRRLLNIASLINSEYKVSYLCSLTDEELFEILDRRLKQ
ncbi:MAG: MerR family transcriptional regulator [Chitinophagaceae bacterium]